MRKSLMCILVAISPAAFAGYVELGSSGNYRISRIDDDNYQELVSFTGSAAYYFWEMSAIELNYTEGKQVVSLKFPNDTERMLTTTIFRMSGLDLIFTLAGKQSAIQPYVKLGGAYVQKRIYKETNSQGRNSVPSQDALVPSAGLGIKLRLTNTLSIKIGVDAWTTKLNNDNVTVDYAGRAGISWMF